MAWCILCKFGFSFHFERELFVVKNVCCSGSLVTRSIADLVKKDDFILDSEYLVTVVVIIPK